MFVSRKVRVDYHLGWKSWVGLAVGLGGEAVYRYQYPGLWRMVGIGKLLSLNRFCFPTSTPPSSIIVLIMKMFLIIAITTIHCV
jgi:hypothetical protein